MIFCFSEVKVIISRSIHYLKERACGMKFGGHERVLNKLGGFLSWRYT